MAELTLEIKGLSFSWYCNQLFWAQVQAVHMHASDIGEKLKQPVYAEQLDLHKEQICLKAGW